MLAGSCEWSWSKQTKSHQLSDPDSHRLGRDTTFGIAVTGAYFKTGKQLQVVVEVTDTRSSRILGVAGPVSAETERPDSSLHVIADSVVAILHHRS